MSNARVSGTACRTCTQTSNSISLACALLCTALLIVRASADSYTCSLSLASTVGPVDDASLDLSCAATAGSYNNLSGESSLVHVTLDPTLPASGITLMGEWHHVGCLRMHHVGCQSS